MSRRKTYTKEFKMRVARAYVEALREAMPTLRKGRSRAAARAEIGELERGWGIPRGFARKWAKQLLEFDDSAF